MPTNCSISPSSWASRCRAERAPGADHADGTAPMSGGEKPSGLFVPGRNCQVVARARRVALLVDGEDYFRSFMLAAQQAVRSIVILSWEFNSQTRLCFDGGEVPERLGEFLNWLARRRRGLRIHVLDWDSPLVFRADREYRSYTLRGWHPHRRVRLVYDDTQPLAASHHQKIVVIDDALAFIGGFDLTVRRWDTCSHAAQEARRTCQDAPYPPFHDLMMAVDGDAARALGQLVRQRWRHATGRRLRPAPEQGAAWPKEMPVDLEEVDVALARTVPELPGQPGVDEVQALYLDMIAAARERIYIENQYFTAYRVGEALAARLAEADGPEIVVVVRLFSHGWLEEHTMHILRTRLVRRLREADAHGRLSIYYPHVDGLEERSCIDLHSKLMIVDDEILRIGSSNLSNRSMGMDTECDAAIDARGDPRIRGVVRAFRNRLLAEHLDAAPEAVEAACRAHGSLRGAIESLAGRERTLRPLDHVPEWSETTIELAGVGDPGQPVSLDAILDELSPEQLIADRAAPPAGSANGNGSGRRAFLVRLALFAVLIGAFAAMWRLTPLAGWIDADRVAAYAREFADRPWAPLIVLAAYTPACVLMFPRPLITLAAVVAFGPYLGFVYSLAGILISALCTYLAGFALPRDSIHRLGGARLMHLADVLRRRSLATVTALRLVPLAPFAVEGLVAAAIGVPLLPFMLGTLFGMLPGTLATTIFGDQFKHVLSDPSRINFGLLAAAVLALTALTLLVRRWLVNQHREMASPAASPAARAHEGH